jgi:hypothetical protein
METMARFTAVAFLVLAVATVMDFRPEQRNVFDPPKDLAWIP